MSYFYNRFDYDDKDFKSVMTIVNEFAGANPDYMVANMYPYIADIALIFNKVGKSSPVIFHFSICTCFLEKTYLKLFIVLRLGDACMCYKVWTWKLPITAMNKNIACYREGLCFCLQIVITYHSKSL